MAFYGGLGESCFLSSVHIPWNVPFTMNPALFSHPLRVNGTALKTAAARYAPLRLHLANRAGLDVPVSTCLSDRLIRPIHGTHPFGADASVVQKRSRRFCPGGQSWMRACVPASFLDAP
jgi:hypothetical protein